MKNQFKEIAIYRNRMMVSLVFVVSLMILLITWVAELQVSQYEKYRTESDNNRIRVLPVAPTRGLIYDRNGIILAENRSVYSLELVPEQIKDIDQTIDELAKILAIDADDRERFYKELQRTRERFKKIPIKSKIDEKEVAVFSVNRHRFPGVSVEARLVRFYPYGEVLVHALGYVGRINDRELQTIDAQNYRATRHIGKVGIEKFYETELHGVIGSQRVESDVQGRVLDVLEQQDPVAGVDLHLELDLPLQLAAFNALKGQRGAVVAIDPKTGGVLALVSTPGYDPNLFVTGISSKDYKALLNEDRPLFNRALRGQYSPGSTIKPHIAWLGLESKTISPNYSIDDNGVYFLPNDEKRRYRDWKKWGHGKNISYRRAIIESCDTFFYDLAYKLGIDRISDTMKQFGFGSLTQIDMGEEVPGLMPSREWKQGARRVHWFPGETVITGIGQGYWLATPLQIANAAAVIANNGVRYQLHVVGAIGSNGERRLVAPSLAELQVDIGDGEHFKRIQNAMKEVNHNRVIGTARSAFADAPYLSAGKTGTVQLFGLGEDEEYEAENLAERLRDNALYIGYAPFDDPTIAVAVVVENAGGGGSNAAPIARKVIDQYLLSSTTENDKP
ncbi:penicillin-binding protein 2 [Pleionea litopenaei]|uniref:Peptidoglycan D,D-transpeptidase MrdA n=1 Tax=Pleionea litopenaei TaxID=3070815 RepID=A0AA51RS73_9GAMM|nr:penicillin-binding protein 2 [Pleionea sp. HL-JVS1]WMS86563.1 penicillin-binding protein 2 [Pleionea sp. HL-JVS1]